MGLMRFVSRDGWNGLQLSLDDWRRLRALLWRDPASEDLLRAMAHTRHVCPVIESWRRMVLRRLRDERP